MSALVATVIGWPVKHSRSPVIHRYWLKLHGIDGDYRSEPVEPGRVTEHFRRIVAGDFVGTNVTVPHKEAAFAAVDERRDAAVVTGAVNTVWLEDGRLIGTNTDPIGFLSNLDAAAPGWDARRDRAVILGAGGAARSLAWALAGRGFGRVSVVNRTVARAENLAHDLGAPNVAASWERLDEILVGASVLINATTLGMAGQPPLAISLGALPDHATVNDIVYTPLETALLIEARARGLAAVDGLGMLLHQAVDGFERWFGVRPSVTADLRAVVLSAMAQS